MRYEGTRGLWELMVKKRPETFEPEDLGRYAEILKSMYQGNSTLSISLEAISGQTSCKKKEFEDTKGADRNRQVEDRQDHGQQNETKDKHRTHNTTLSFLALIFVIIEIANTTSLGSKTAEDIRTY